MPWWLLIGVALADPAPTDEASESAEAPSEPTEPEAPSAPTDTATAAYDVVSEPLRVGGVNGSEVSSEIEVVDRERVLRARARVLEEAEDLGYTREVRRPGRTILRHDAVWKGEVVIFDNGRVQFKRQPVRFEPLLGDGPAAWITCIIPVLCLKAGGQTVGKRKLAPMRREVLQATDMATRAWNDRIADLAVRQKVEEIVSRLEALWNEGTALDGGANVATMAARREAIFRFWDSRTDNPWGLQVRDAVGAFVRGLVMQSADPYTDDELARFERERVSSVPFPALRAPIRGDLDHDLAP